MVIVQYRKVKCDICEKEVEIKEQYGSLPRNWYELSATQWFGSSGRIKFNKEVCSEKCLKKAMHEFKNEKDKV